MSFEPGYDDQQLLRYLLGLLPDEEAERLDEASITDEAVAGRLRVAENDLVDAYATGTLSGETQERFESFYLSSARRRQHARFAESLLRAVNRVAEPADMDIGGSTGRSAAADKGVGSRDGSARLRIVPRPKPSWRLAAALLLLAFGPRLFRDVRLRSGLADLQRQRAALNGPAHELERQPDDERAAGAQVIKELAHIRAPMPARAPQSATDRLTNRLTDREAAGSQALGA